VNGAPSVQSQAIPPDLTGLKDEVEDMLREEKEEQEENRRPKEQGLGVPMEY
jgi:histone deacetylase HOS2